MDKTKKLLAFLIPVLAFTQTPLLLKYFYKRLEGVITAPTGAMAVTMNFFRLGNDAGGGYYYNRFGAIIDLGGTIEDDGQIRLRESVGDNETGVFKGRFVADSVVIGVWQNSDSTASYLYQLRERYPPGSAFCIMNHFDKKLGDGEKDGSYSVTYTYPQLDKFPDQMCQELINRQLKDGKDPDELEKSMAADYQTLRESYQEDTATAYYYTRRWEKYEISRIVYNGDFLLSIETYHYEYTGGAHPNSAFSLISFDLRTGRPLNLTDLLAEKDLGKFNRIAEEIFRKGRGLGPNDDLDSAGFWFVKGQFALNDNYLFTRAGVRFVFNPYEITAYAEGPIDVLVPYAKIKPLLKKDNPLRKMIK